MSPFGTHQATHVLGCTMLQNYSLEEASESVVLAIAAQVHGLVDDGERIGHYVDGVLDKFRPRVDDVVSLARIFGRRLGRQHDCSDWR